jgi:DNA-binding MarR family transcriptional regulator
MTLKDELKQKKPFPNVQEEVHLALVRTADLVGVRLTDLLRAEGLSPSQYNVLRILRGMGEEGLPCGEISERMVRRDPDLTRLLDRLETRGLVTRARGTSDRRVVRASLTGDGVKLLARLDAPVEAAVKQALQGVPVAKLKILLELLEEVRLAASSHK